jgi:hypothetical protein
MDEDWTPEQKTEWKSRWDASTEDSQERLILDDMRWTGIYAPAGASSPSAQYFTAQQPPSLEFAPPPPEDLSPPPPSPEPVSPEPLAIVPPLYPVPPPAQNPDEAVKKAQMNAFFDRKPQPTPAQMEEIRQKAMPPPGIPPGGIAAMGTRRQVFGRGRTLKTKKGGKIVAIFFNIRDQIKLYHWQTRSFAEHKATDDLVGKMDTNIDTFVEAYMGRYGRPRMGQTYPLKNLTVTGIRAFIARSDEWLTFKLPRMVKNTDTDLLNIRDEILADLNQIKYLFTLA